MSDPVTHLRLGLSDREDQTPWVSECGHFVTTARSTSLYHRVTCKGCKRTRAWKQHEAAAALLVLREKLAGKAS